MVVREGVSADGLSVTDLAMVAVCSDQQDGCILLYRGNHITCDVEGISPHPADVDLLGYEDLPLGIWVWEGCYETYICPKDGPQGRPRTINWREPTEEEWRALREHRNPWDD